MNFKSLKNSIARTIPIGRSQNLEEKASRSLASQVLLAMAELFQVVFLLDNSYSMDGNKGSLQLMEGLDAFVSQVCKDPKLAKMLEISVWTFGDSSPTKMVSDFVPAREFTAPVVIANCYTYLWELVSDGIEHTLDRKQIVERELDADSRAAWVFVPSDFCALDDAEKPRAMQAIAKATEANVNLFLLGCGDSPNRAVMESMAQPGRPPVMITEIGSWKVFFDWLIVSLRTKSQSIPQQPNELPLLGNTSLIGDG